MQETPTSSLTTFLAERNLLYIQQYSILSIHLTELFKVLHGIVVEALFKVTILELVREVGVAVVREVGVAGLPMLLLLLLVEGGGEGGVALGLGQGVQCAEILGRSELARTVFRYKQACIL